MKFATVGKSLILALVVLMAAGAFAAAKANLQLGSAVLVNGTTLKPGEYKVQWDGNGPDIELSFIQGKNVVAKVPARIAELQAPAADDAAVTHKNESGPNSLSSLRFQGKKFSLELEQPSAAMQSGSSK